MVGSAAVAITKDDVIVITGLVLAALTAEDVLLAELPVRVIVGMVDGLVTTRLVHGLQGTPRKGAGRQVGGCD